MSAMVKRELWTLEEVGREVKRTYGTIRLWIREGRMRAETKEKNGRVYYRVPVAEVDRVKNEIERGAWF